MPFIMMQQVHPDFIMALQQSQQAWIMSQQALSPLVQVMQTPLSVISHLHIAIVRLQQQAIIPFIMQQQEHIPPAIMVQRFWIMVADIASSLAQVIFMPPVHFSILMVQRGTIIMFDPVGMVEGEPMAPVPVAPMLMPIRFARSIIMAVVIVIAPDCEGCRYQPESPSRRLDHGPDYHDHPAYCKTFAQKYANSYMTWLCIMLINRKIVKIATT
jgi:hypothetical protein